MDATERLIERMRSDRSSRPFKRLKLWLIYASIILAAGLVAWSLKLLFTQQPGL